MYLDVAHIGFTYGTLRVAYKGDGTPSTTERILFRASFVQLCFLARKVAYGQRFPRLCLMSKRGNKPPCLITTYRRATISQQLSYGA